MDKNLSADEIEATLLHFTGSETFLRYGNSIITEGVKFLATSAGAYWLLDVINSIQYLQNVKQEYFQVFDLKVLKNTTGIVEVSDGNKKIIYRQVIPFTDFPLESITLWRVDGTILLPSEY